MAGEENCVVTETTYEAPSPGGGGGGGGGEPKSYTDRVKSSCGMIVVGVVLFLGSFFLLGWNEKRAVERYDTLNEGESQVQSINGLELDTANEGKLLHFTADIYNAGDALVDPVFNIQTSGLKLVRGASMYQWKQHASTKTTTLSDGTKKKETTYSWKKGWYSYLIDSKQFKDCKCATDHRNPSSMEFRDASWTASDIKIGAYQLPGRLKGAIDWSRSLPAPVSNVTATLRNRIKLTRDGTFYFTNDVQQPVLSAPTTSQQAPSPVSSPTTTQVASTVPKTALKVTADTHIRNGEFSKTAYGNDKILHVKKDVPGYTRIALLQFDNVPARTSFAKAKLRLYNDIGGNDATRRITIGKMPLNSASTNFKVSEGNTPWSVVSSFYQTWDTSPTRGYTAMMTFDLSNTQMEQWIEVDVTDLMDEIDASTGGVTFALENRGTMTGTNSVNLRSREYVGYEPELVFETAATAPTMTKPSPGSVSGYDYVGYGVCTDRLGQMYPSVRQIYTMTATECGQFCDKFPSTLRGFYWNNHANGLDKHCSCVFDAGSDVKTLASTYGGAREHWGKMVPADFGAEGAGTGVIASTAIPSWVGEGNDVYCYKDTGIENVRALQTAPAAPTSPTVGDQRVSFRETQPATFTIVGVQNGQSLSAFVSETESGGDILFLKRGTHSAEVLFDEAEASNKATTWILRFVGYIMMALGLYIVFRPIVVMTDVIPCVGSIVGCGIKFMAITIAAVLSMLTISIAWLITHPKIGGITLAVSLAVIGLAALVFKKCCDKGKDKLEEEVMEKSFGVEAGSEDRATKTGALDLNGDGKVDSSDVKVAIDMAKNSKQLDLNKDGKVDSADAKIAIAMAKNSDTLDLNNDGKVDSADVKVAVEMAKNSDTLDLNHDGKVDSKDAKMALEMVK